MRAVGQHYKSSTLPPTELSAEMAPGAAIIAPLLAQAAPWPLCSFGPHCRQADEKCAAAYCCSYHVPTMSNTAPKIGVITISDRASRGEYEDISGPAIVAALEDYLITDVEFLIRVIADERDLIGSTIVDLAAAGCSLICTTGGTGPTLRDVTPEAIEDVCAKMMPGFGEAMRGASLAAGVPTAILSRQTAALIDKSLVVTLPGKPAAVRVCLDAVFPAIPYCIDLIGGAYFEGNPEVVDVFRPKPK
jgi:molybdopterin adenylyltransferase